MFGDNPDAVVVDLAAGTAVSSWGGRDGLIGIEGAVGTAKADVFIGTGDDNQFFGGDGNDRFVFNGGTGSDTLTGFGFKRQYGVSASSGDAHIGGTTAHAVERIEFDDGVLVTGVGDTAAQVYRLYDAVLDRNPDASGLRN